MAAEITTETQIKKPAHQKYNSTFPDAIITKATTDPTFYCTPKNIIELLGCSRPSYFRWLMRHPEFAAAVDYAQEICNDRAEAALFHRAVGGAKNKTTITKTTYDDTGSVKSIEETVTVNAPAPPDTKALIFYLKNRQPGRWQDKIDAKTSGNITVVMQSEDKNFF